MEEKLGMFLVFDVEMNEIDYIFSSESLCMNCTHGTVCSLAAMH